MTIRLDDTELVLWKNTEVKIRRDEKVERFCGIIQREISVGKKQIFQHTLEKIRRGNSVASKLVGQRHRIFGRVGEGFWTCLYDDKETNL